MILTTNLYDTNIYIIKTFEVYLIKSRIIVKYPSLNDSVLWVKNFFFCTSINLNYILFLKKNYLEIVFITRS